jgi:hypothetical protein
MTSYLSLTVIYIRDPMSLRKIAWSQFLRPATIRTRQILLGFYPSVQITSQLFYVTRLSTSSFHGKSIAIGIFLSKLLQIWPGQCGWEWWGYIQYMPHLASCRHRRCNTINAVPRQSFVIHPNGGRWQSRQVSGENWLNILGPRCHECPLVTNLHQNNTVRKHQFA